MMDTYTNFNFNVTLQVENNSVKNIKSVYLDKVTYNAKMPSFPFIVTTNPEAKLWRADHSRHSINLLCEDIEEVTLLMGPWIGNSAVDVYVPFVLNDLKRF